MSEEKVFRIKLPTLIEQVNQRRKAQGLPEVEPAIMAVRASIKFAIRRQKPMDLQGDQLEMDRTDADALCQTLGELFNVDLRLGDSQAESQDVSAPLTQTDSAVDGATYVLPMFQYYASINRERRKKGLQPAEPAIISVRTGIKFSIMRKRTLNFREDKLFLSKDDLKALDTIIAHQFDVDVPGGLISLCKRPEEIAKPSPQPAATAATSQPKGLLARIVGRLTDKLAAPHTEHAAHHTHHYSLDTNNLLLAIITRRAYLGHRPITPDKVKTRCGKALSAELELEVDMDDEKISLTDKQLDEFAEVIRKEFEIMFEDIDDLLGKKPEQ